MPREREASERGLLDRLDLLAEARERPLAERAQHAGVDPLHAGRARTELTLEQRAVDRELAERARDESRSDAEAACEIPRGERSVGARAAARGRSARRSRRSCAAST